MVSFGEGFASQKNLHVNLSKELPSFKKCETFSLNDGQYLFDVIDYNEGSVLGRSQDEFVLLPKKGINLPGSVYDEDLQYNIYQEFVQEQLILISMDMG